MLILKKKVTMELLILFQSEGEAFYTPWCESGSVYTFYFGSGAALKRMLEKKKGVLPSESSFVIKCVGFISCEKRGGLWHCRQEGFLFASHALHL